MAAREMEMNKSVVVEMRSIRKTFPGVVANENVDFTCIEGEVHALLGENGAGKSTLMKILSWLYKPDSGEVYVRGKPVTISSPREAIHLGIGMVHQELRLVRSLSVTENIVLGSEGLPFFYSNKDKQEEVREFSVGIGLEVDPGVPVWQLSVGEQQRVEILKVLYRGIKLLVVDEPTALLTPQETHKLFEYLRRIAATGCSITFITHKLEEVMEVADRITILRHGETVATMPKKDTNKHHLVRLMIGQPPESESPRLDSSPGKTILELQDVNAMGDHKGLALSGVSFSLARGEILGVAGVAGNGQRELAEVLTGMRQATGGQILFTGCQITNRTPHEILRLGVGYIPEDRMGMGLVPSLSVCENLILRDYDREPFSGRVFIRQKSVVQTGKRLIKEFGIKTHDMNLPVRTLSGGNIQKVILAREISRQPRLLIAVNPTRGLDVGAAQAIHEMLLQQKSAGTAMLLISEDLDELFELSDRIAVMYKGGIRGIFGAERHLIDEIGLMMGGVF